MAVRYGAEPVEHLDKVEGGLEVGAWLVVPGGQPASVLAPVEAGFDLVAALVRGGGRTWAGGPRWILSAAGRFRGPARPGCDDADLVQQRDQLLGVGGLARCLAAPAAC